MQDANVVINYDLPLSADLLFQRAGRVIRMTAEVADLKAKNAELEARLERLEAVLRSQK